MSFLLPVSGFNPPPYIADGANYASDVSRRTAILSGAADTVTQTCSFWFNITANPSGSYHQICQTTGDYGVYIIHTATDGDIRYRGANNTAQQYILDVETTTKFLTGTNAGWHHFFMSANMVSTPVVLLYIDGVEDKSSAIETAGEFENESTSFPSLFTLGGNRAGGVAHPGIDLFDFWYSQSEFVDFSDAAIRAKWIDGSGKPVDLGADGSTPTGTAPIVFCHLDDGETAGNFDINAGTGGSIVTGGDPTLATSSTSPTD
jgi:hypothetical protein